MANNVSTVHEIIFGRWKGRILHAGVALGVFDAIAREGRHSANDVAQAVGADPTLLYRLLRALGSMGFLDEDPKGRFALTELGELLRSDTAGSLQGLILLQEGEEHYAIWSDLAGMIREGRQNGFLREFGSRAFDYAETNPGYSAAFSAAMSSASTMQAAMVVKAMSTRGLSGISSLCDVGGGQGHLMCSLLGHFNDATGVVLDLPEVVDGAESLFLDSMNVQGRCTFIGGDMFENVPEAGAYFLKLIIHDWDDEKSVVILERIRASVPDNGRLFVIERIVPDSGVPHFSKLYDIHMLCWGDGQERTLDQYKHLLDRSGWALVRVLPVEGSDLAIIEAVPVEV